ncbi:MAG: DUF58 domain-containing protein [Chloroflexota bacterium]
MNVRIKINSWMLPIIVISIVILQIVDPSRSWKMLLVFFGGTWLTGWYWALSLSKGLHFSREMRFGWTQVGDELEERFIFNNQSHLPATWVEIRDFSTMPDYNPSMATFIRENSTSEFFTHGVCSRRGLFQLGGCQMKSGDPFGLFQVLIDYPLSQSLLVLPPVVSIPEINISPGGYFGDGKPNIRSLEKSVSASSVREYLPGDSMGLIHWAKTASYGKPYIRNLDGTPTADWWIVLDLDISAQTGSGWDSTEEHGIILAASLVDRCYKNKKPIGMAINGETGFWQPPERISVNRLRIFQALALAKTGNGTLKQFILGSKKSFGSLAALVIITANVNPNWLDALAELRWQGRVIPTVMLFDPVSFGGIKQPGGLKSILDGMGIDCHIISRDLLNTPEAHPGDAGRWKWRTSATGKAIPIIKPVESQWKSLN